MKGCRMAANSKCVWVCFILVLKSSPASSRRTYCGTGFRARGTGRGRDGTGRERDREGGELGGTWGEGGRDGSCCSLVLSRAYLVPVLLFPKLFSCDAVVSPPRVMLWLVHLV